MTMLGKSDNCAKNNRIPTKRPGLKKICRTGGQFLVPKGLIFLFIELVMDNTQSEKDNGEIWDSSYGHSLWLANYRAQNSKCTGLC